MQRILSFLMVMIFAITTATTASADGWSIGGQYLYGRTVTRVSYEAFSVSGTSEFSSYGIVVAHTWQLGDSPYRLAVVGGIYGGGVSESGTWTSGADSLTLAYSQPMALTLGARFSADYGRWSPYLEGGLLATSHSLTGSLTQAGVTTDYSESARTLGAYVQAGVGVDFMGNGRLNLFVQARHSSAGAVVQDALAVGASAVWRF